MEQTKENLWNPIGKEDKGFSLVVSTGVQITKYIAGENRM
jgi:hypothetical protein